MIRLCLCLCSIIFLKHTWSESDLELANNDINLVIKQRDHLKIMNRDLSIELEDLRQKLIRSESEYVNIHIHSHYVIRRYL